MPQLWYNEDWAESFSDFIFDLTGEHNPPEVIEIHPPFDDYIGLMDKFLDIYKIFENRVHDKYTNTKILIENRCGSIYQGGKFLVSNANDLEVLVEKIESRNAALKITLDIPQLFSSHPEAVISPNKMEYIFERIKNIRNYIAGIHLWGKRRNKLGRKIPHIGDLNSYFYHN